jgi:predicted Zn finger-like uncharacterized protein
MSATAYFTVSCPSCRSEFPVDPDRVPSDGVPAVCSECMRVFRVHAPVGVFQPTPDAPPFTGEGAEEAAGEEVPLVEGSELVQEPDVMETAQDLGRDPGEPEALEAPDGLEESQALDQVDGFEEFEEFEVVGEFVEVEEVEGYQGLQGFEEPGDPHGPEEALQVEEAPGFDDPEPSVEPGEAAEPDPVTDPESAREPEPSAEPEPPHEPTPMADPEPGHQPDPAPVADAPTTSEVEGKTLSQGIARFGRRDPKERARRLARVLVSDMITYHPARYEEALENDSLRELFQEEVEKSWKEFVDQVGEEMAESSDYFVEALNEILARGRVLYQGPGRPR